jgi:hypothetical protein
MPCLCTWLGASRAATSAARSCLCQWNTRLRYVPSDGPTSGPAPAPAPAPEEEEVAEEEDEDEDEAEAEAGACCGLPGQVAADADAGVLVKAGGALVVRKHALRRTFSSNAR